MHMQKWGSFRPHSRARMLRMALVGMRPSHWTLFRQNNIIKAALRSSGKVAAIASEEDDRPIWLGEAPYVVVFDPLDGSRNIDASIPTGTIFGIYRRLPEADHLPMEEKAFTNVMQRGERQAAAGYALYSSAPIMAISVGSRLHGFTLDYTIGEFVYSHTTSEFLKEVLSLPNVAGILTWWCMLRTERMCGNVEMKLPGAKIAPSMLSSDFANLASEAKFIQECGTDWLHMDIMQGYDQV